MAKRNSFKKGTIELLTLAILQDGDCYGYQITQSICDKSNGIITVTEGELYPILYRLVDKGYLTDYKKPAGKRLMRVYYHLEEAGVIYFHELLEEYNQVKLGVGEEAENDTAPHIYNHGLVTIGEKSVIPDGISVGKNSVISGVTAAADYEDSQLASGKTLIKAGE